MDKLARLSFALLLWLTIPAARASLILEGTVRIEGVGIGHVAEVLTIRGGQGSGAYGCVGWNGVTDVIGQAGCVDWDKPAGDEMTGASQTLTQTLSGSGIRSAADLRVVYVPGPQDPVLTGLVVTVFSPTGSVLFSSGPSTMAFVPTPQNQNGQTGFVFRLSDQDLAGIPGAAFSSPANRIGLSAAVAGSTPGPQRFFIASAESLYGYQPPSPLPEPATAWGALAGLAVAAWQKRRRQRPGG